PAQTALPGRVSLAPHPSEVLRFCSNRASSYRATWLMRASLAVALREYNGRASLENPFNYLYEAKRQHDYARCGFQSSSFTFTEIGLRTCGGAPALRWG